MRVWKCDKCGKIYEKVTNDLIRDINEPLFSNKFDDWSAHYFKLYNKSLDIETDFMNLCDGCMHELFAWLKEKA